MYGLNRRSASTDAFLGLPVDVAPPSTSLLASLLPVLPTI